MELTFSSFVLGTASRFTSYLPLLAVHGSSDRWLVGSAGAGTGAAHDVVRLYAGVDETAPLLAEFSGLQSPGQVSSPGSNLHLVFATDGIPVPAAGGVTPVGQGWSAYWSVTVGAPCPLDALAAPPDGTKGTCTGDGGAHSSDVDRVLLPGESCDLACPAGSTIAYASHGGGGGGAPACIAGKWTAASAECVSDAPPSRLLLSGLCDSDLNRVFTLSGSINGKGVWTSPNGFQLYFTNGAYGPRWFLDSDLDDSHCVASLPLRSVADAGNAPADQATWQVWCNRRWTSVSVSITARSDHCGTTPPPCQNAGRCVEQADGCVCICAPGTAGVHCEQITCTPAVIAGLQAAIDARYVDITQAICCCLNADLF